MFNYRSHYTSTIFLVVKTKYFDLTIGSEGDTVTHHAAY